MQDNKLVSDEYNSFFNEQIFFVSFRLTGGIYKIALNCNSQIECVDVSEYFDYNSA